MLRTKKLYIDSRFKSIGSISNTNFDFELSDNLDLPDNCIAYFDDIVIPHTWWNIDINNNCLYIRRLINSTIEDKIISLNVGQYNVDQMAVELQSQLRSAFPNGSGDFIVQYVNTKGFMTINPNASNVQFLILTDTEIYNKLNNTWTGASYNIRQPNSFNDTLRNTEGASQTYSTSNIFTSGFIDILCGKHYLYLTSSNFGCYNALGPRGELNIIKKIAVTSNYAYNIVEAAAFSGDDYLDLSRQSLKMLSFQLRDAFGSIIDLHGSNISFSIVFFYFKTRYIKIKNI